MSRTTKCGFTLIELSIVLVIIGLIVGGVLAGSHLIKVARLRNIAATVSEYKTAVNTFRFKFNGMPGDLANATQFFGISSAGCPFSGWASSTGTCNGDGNGVLGSPSSLAGNESAEYLRFWEQLSRANMVAESFSTRGYLNSRSCTTSPCPEYFLSSKQAGILVIQGGWANVSTNVLSPTKSGVALYFIYGYDGNGTGITGYPSLSQVDAYIVDSKFDDGLPWSGSITATYNASVWVCGWISTKLYGYSDVYTYPSSACTVYFDAGF